MIARSAVILLYETLLADPSTKRQTAKTVQLGDLLGMWSNEFVANVLLISQQVV
jgi:hypothetical protein